MENFPDAGDDLIVLLSRGEDLFEQLEKAHRVYEKRPVDAIDFLTTDMSIQKALTIDTVTVDRVLVLWLCEDARDLKMIGICKCLVDPSLKDAVRDMRAVATFELVLQLDIVGEDHVILSRM